MTGQIDNPYQLINLRGAALAAVETLTLAGEKPENPEFLDATLSRCSEAHATPGTHSNNSFVPLIRHRQFDLSGELLGHLAIQGPAVSSPLCVQRKRRNPGCCQCKNDRERARVSSDW